MKSVYIFDGWIPFPASEYGGMYIVIADSVEEVIEIVIGNSDKHRLRSFPNHLSLIRKKIRKGKVITAESLMTAESGIVDSFLV